MRENLHSKICLEKNFRKSHGDFSIPIITYKAVCTERQEKENSLKLKCLHTVLLIGVPHTVRTCEDSIQLLHKRYSNITSSWRLTITYFLSQQCFATSTATTFATWDWISVCCLNLSLLSSIFCFHRPSCRRKNKCENQ